MSSFGVSKFLVVFKVHFFFLENIPSKTIEHIIARYSPTLSFPLPPFHDLGRRQKVCDPTEGIGITALFREAQLRCVFFSIFFSGFSPHLLWFSFLKRKILFFFLNNFRSVAGVKWKDEMLDKYKVLQEKQKQKRKRKKSSGGGGDEPSAKKGKMEEEEDGQSTDEALDEFEPENDDFAVDGDGVGEGIGEVEGEVDGDGDGEGEGDDDDDSMGEDDDEEEEEDSDEEIEE